MQCNEYIVEMTMSLECSKQASYLVNGETRSYRALENDIQYKTLNMCR